MHLAHDSRSVGKQIKELFDPRMRLVLVVGALVNVVLDPVLIFGFAGVPGLGLAGVDGQVQVADNRFGIGRTGVKGAVDALEADHAAVPPLPRMRR